VTKRGTAWSDVGSLPTVDTATGPQQTTVGAALHVEEVTRTRVFLRVVLTLVVMTLGVVPLLPGDPLATRILLAAAGICAVACVVFHRVIGKPGGYTAGRLFAFVLVAELAVLTGAYFFGMLSAAPIGFVLGISVFGLASSKRVTTALYAITALGYGGLAALVILGVVPDRGLLPVAPLGVTGGLVIVGTVQAFMFFAYLQARLTRRTTLEAVTRLERAVRAVAQRDAVLQEARQELERAAWIGGPGRFTEQTLGSWRLGVVIGRGAMGEVYAAEHVERGEAGAVKLLHRNVLADPKAVSRFVREAKAVAQIDSPHVVRVLGVSDESAPIPYLVLEYLRGHDLAHHLREERRFRPEWVVDLLRQTARGLDAAHRAGIVHRDLKPHNLFLHEGDAPAWKILDFGMSKLVGSGGTLTRDTIVGTPTFMSPEQAAGGDVDPRADLYALGAVAYRALTGELPFADDDPAIVLREVTTQMPFRPGISPAVDAVLAIALAKRPEDRFPSAAALAEAMAAAVAGRLPAELVDQSHDVLRRHPWRVRGVDRPRREDE
jgi:eukaryotic-like serine/threonine-protein kinase